MLNGKNRGRKNSGLAVTAAVFGFAATGAAAPTTLGPVPGLVPQVCVSCQAQMAEQAQAQIAPAATQLAAHFQTNVASLLNHTVQLNFATPTMEMARKPIFSGIGSGIGELPSPPSFETPYLSAQYGLINHPSAPWNRVLGPQVGALMYQLTVYPGPGM